MFHMKSTPPDLDMNQKYGNVMFELNHHHCLPYESCKVLTESLIGRCLL
jgi:hypothetical protein